jgi:hypothetical protein
MSDLQAMRNSIFEVIDAELHAELHRNAVVMEAIRRRGAYHVAKLSIDISILVHIGHAEIRNSFRAIQGLQPQASQQPNPKICAELETTIPPITDSHAGTNLDSRIQALPQELQDAILEHTDAFHILPTTCVTQQYKPPVALQLNRKLRAKFVAEYYSATIFEYQFPPTGDELMADRGETLALWLSKLWESHRGAFPGFQVRLPGYWPMDLVHEYSQWVSLGFKISCEGNDLQLTLCCPSEDGETVDYCEPEKIKKTIV